MPSIDLHTHSTKSDGTLTPAQLVEMARELGLAALALTDHDSVDGIAEAEEAAERFFMESPAEDPAGCSPEPASGYGTELVPGVEVSTEYKGRSVHIVGLFPDWRNPRFRESLRRFSDAREERNRKMCELLRGKGVDIYYEDLCRAFPGNIITRTHFARYMLQKGYVSRTWEAFQTYIGDDRPCFVPRIKISATDAVRFLLRFHAFTVLAHPIQYYSAFYDLEELLADLKAAGLQGIECYYGSHTMYDFQTISRYASEYGLLPSGGSDFHGANKPGLRMGVGYGHMSIPARVLTDIKHAHYHTGDSTRIFFCDFDGTLARTDKSVSPYSREVLDRWTAAGHRFVFSSGRIMADIKVQIRRLGLHLPGMLLSACNGAEIYDCDSGVTLYKRTLNRDQIRKIQAIADSIGLFCLTHSDSRFYVPREGPETEFYFRTVRIPYNVCEDLAEAVDELPCKIHTVSLEDPDKLAIFRRLIGEAFGDELNVYRTHPCYVEVVPGGVSKGHALQWLCRRLGIRPENSLAAGDSENDLSMLQAAATGILMRNGAEMNPYLKDGADLVTEYDNDQDGLARTLASILDRIDA